MPMDERTARIEELEREIELALSEDEGADATTLERSEAMLARLRQLHDRIEQGEVEFDGEDGLLLAALVGLEIRARERETT